MNKKNDLGYQVDWEPKYSRGSKLFWLMAMALMWLIWWIGFYTTVIWVFEWLMGRPHAGYGQH